MDLTPKSSMTNGTAAPNSSMTNGTVAQKSNKVENNKVNSVEGNDVTVNFNGGTKIVTVTSDTKVVTLVPDDRSELKPNAKIFIPAATRTPDGAWKLIGSPSAKTESLRRCNLWREKLRVEKGKRGLRLAAESNPVVARRFATPACDNDITC